MTDNELLVAISDVFEQKLSPINKYMISLDFKIDELERWMKSEMKHLNMRLHSLEIILHDNVLPRLENMESLIQDNILPRLESVENRLENVENRLENVENRLENVENRLENVEDRLENVENRLENVENRLENVEDRIQNIEAKLETDISPRLKSIEVNLETDISPRLITIEECYLSTFERYKAGVEQIDAMQMDIEVTKSVLREHSTKLLKIS